MKKKIIISERDLIRKLFSESNVGEITPIGFKAIQRKKVVVFVPESHLEEVFNAMSHSGAGIIGEYKMCSFRIEGTGTYKPASSSRPFSGRKGIVNYETEIKLEMECDSEALMTVIVSMLDAHPYEEVAYEIYSFFKFSNETDGVFIKLKKSVTLSYILKKLNTKIEEHHLKMNLKVKTIVLVNDENNQKYDADLVIQKSKEKFKIKKIK